MQLHPVYCRRRMLVCPSVTLYTLLHLLLTTFTVLVPAAIVYQPDVTKATPLSSIGIVVTSTASLPGISLATTGAGTGAGLLGQLSSLYVAPVTSQPIATQVPPADDFVAGDDDLVTDGDPVVHKLIDSNSESEFEMERTNTIYPSNLRARHQICR